MRDPVLVRFASADWPDDAEVFELEAVERISAPFSFDLVVASSATGDPSSALGKPATISFGRGDVVQREVHGIIWSIEDRGELVDDRRLHRLRVVPRVEAMTLQVGLEVFVDVALPDMLRATLADAGLREDEDFELRLSETYPKRELIVQYEETDLAFLSRLCEHAGVAWFFEHRGGRDVIVFSDSNRVFSEIDPVPLRPRGEKTDLYDLEISRRIVPQSFVVRDYDYKNPQLDLTASAKLSGGIGGTVIEHGAHHETKEEGATIARVRAEEQQAQRVRYRAKTDEPRIAAAHTFAVDDYERELELLVLEIRHRGRREQGSDGQSRMHYEGAIEAIARDVTFRPPRVTPKPKVPGIITGHIDAALKSEYAQVDEQGRYRVRLEFDTRRHDAGKGSRPIRMAQPHTGPGYGMHFPLRKGVEVVLACIGGDPDRPVIVGTVPNAMTPSVVDANDATKNVIRTGGGNQIALDDTKGEERIKLSTPSGGTTFQLGSPNAPEHGAMLATTAAATTTALAGITTIGAFKTAISAMTDYRSSGSITAVAEPSEKSKYLIVMGALDALSSAVISSCDLIEKGYEIDKINVQAGADRAADKLKRASDAAEHDEKELEAILASLEKTKHNDRITERAKLLRKHWARLHAARAKRIKDLARVRRARSRVTKDMVEGEPEKEFLAAAERDLNDDEVEIAAAQRALYGELLASRSLEGGDNEGIKKLEERMRILDRSDAEQRAADEENQREQLKAKNWKFKDTDAGAVVGDIKKYATAVKTGVNVAGQVVKYGGAVIHFVSGLFAETKKTEEKITNEKRWARIGLETVYAYSSKVSAAAWSEPGWAMGGWSLPLNTVHVLGSRNSTALYGEKNLLLWGEKIGIEAGKDLFASVGERFYVAVEKEGELHSRDRLLLSSKNKTVVYSNTEVKLESLKAVKVNTWNGPIALDSMQDVTIEAKKGVKVETASGDLSLSAPLGAVEASGGSVKITSPKTIEASVLNSKVTITPASIRLEAGGTSVEVLAAGISVTIGGNMVLAVDHTGLKVIGADGMIMGDLNVTGKINGQ